MAPYGAANASAALVTVEALRGRLPADSAALIATVLNLAGAVDDAPDSPGLWREYRAALTDLYEHAAPDTGGDDDAFAASVRTPLRNGADA